MKSYQVTFWSKNITDDGKDQKIESTYSIKEHPHKFASYDDDGLLYARGTCMVFDENVHDTLQNNYGVTLTDYFDRSTNKKLDSIG